MYSSPSTPSGSILGGAVPTQTSLQSLDARIDNLISVVNNTNLDLSNLRNRVFGEPPPSARIDRADSPEPYGAIAHLNFRLDFLQRLIEEQREISEQLQRLA